MVFWAQSAIQSYPDSVDVYSLYPRNFRVTMWETGPGVDHLRPYGLATRPGYKVPLVITTI